MAPEAHPTPPPPDSASPAPVESPEPVAAVPEQPAPVIPAPAGPAPATIAPKAPAIGIAEAPAKPSPATATAARVTRLTEKAVCVENAAGQSLWLPKSVIVPPEAVPVTPSDTPWSFTVKSWFAKKEEFQAWRKP